MRQSGLSATTRNWHEEPGPLYSFFGATPDSWIGKLWPRGRAWQNNLSQATLADNFCNRWSGGLNFLRVVDYVAVCVPFGLFFGRLANFVNGELWGRVAGEGVRWAMVFPDAGPFARHPSQLYEAALEGLVLMIVLDRFYGLDRVLSGKT